jgi:hypothetical protein
LEQQDPLLHIIMVHTQFTAGDHVEINSPYSQYDGVHGTVLKLTLKHVAVALDMDLDVPLNFQAQTYVLPKHLHMLNPETLTNKSDTFPYTRL